MITREQVVKILCHYDNSEIDRVMRLITAEREQYQALVEAAVAWQAKYGPSAAWPESVNLNKAVQPFIPQKPSERLEELADNMDFFNCWDERELREIAAAVREMEK